MGCVGLLVGTMALLYGGLWWYGKNMHPIQYGISFSSQHAAWLHDDWKRIYEEMLHDFKPPFVRLSVDWDELEAKEGVYDFSSIDFMMNEAAKQRTKVLLTVGQKTPRWPECHIPAWALEKTDSEYVSNLYAYVTAVVDRYKKHEALEYWQIENEPYIKFDFGNCKKFDEKLLDEEVKIVRQHDPDHRIIVTDSGELGLWYTAAKKGDIFGTTMYRIVATSKGTPLTYAWLPIGWYRAHARLLGLTSDRFFISELQAEPWIGSGNLISTPIEEQFKTMDIDRMKKNIEEAAHTGASRAYLWGVEWWYWMKYMHDDQSFIDLAKKYTTGAAH